MTVTDDYSAVQRETRNAPCQRIAHDRACRNVTGDPAACAPTCQPAPCRAEGDHPGTDHLDPRSPHYSGPILPGYREGEAFRTILAVLPDTLETRVAIHFLVEALRTAEKQAIHARVDRDRGIREAMARSESCEHHGEEIRALGVQLRGINASARHSEAGRVALLGLLFAVDELVRQHKTGRINPELTVDKLVTALAQSAKKTHAAHDRAWTR